MEDRGGVSREGQEQGRGAGERVPRRVPGVRGQQWLDVQREEFKRLGVVGDWDNPYTTMAFPAEATIARELMKFAENGLLYRGSKPVMWSVVEKTALAEAEVEYQDYQSDMVWVKFPVTCRRWDGRTGRLDRQLIALQLLSGRPRPGRSPATARSLLVEDRIWPL
jgi:hypothetical protein